MQSSSLSYLPGDPRNQNVQSNNHNSFYQNGTGNSHEQSRSLFGSPMRFYTPATQNPSFNHLFEEASTTQFSPRKDQNGAIPQNESSETPPKRRFRVYSRLEMKGLASDIRRLEEEMSRYPSDTGRLELQRLRYQELGSCYQVTKDILVKTNEQLVEAQATQTALTDSLKRSEETQALLREEINKRDAQLAASRASHALLATKVTDLKADKESLEKDYERKKRKFGEATSELTTAEQRHAGQLAEVKRECQEKITVFEVLLQTEREKFAEAVDAHEKTTHKYALAITAAYDKEVELKQCIASKTLVEEKLSSEQERIRNLEQMVSELRNELDGLHQQAIAHHTEKADLQSTLDAHQRCLQGIDGLIQTLKNPPS